MHPSRKVRDPAGPPGRPKRTSTYKTVLQRWVGSWVSRQPLNYMKSSLHCFMVSAGPVVVWPMVFSDS